MLSLAQLSIPDSSPSMSVSATLKNGLIRNPSVQDLLNHCKDLDMKIASEGDSYLLSILNHHYEDSKNISPVTLPEYKVLKDTPKYKKLMDFLSKDKVLLERLQILCRMEIEEVFRDHEDMLSKDLILESSALLIGFHANICQLIGTADAKSEIQHVSDTLIIWLAEEEQKKAEKELISLGEEKFKQKYPDKPDWIALKTFTNLFGVAGLFKSADHKYISGSLWNGNLSKMQFFEFLKTFITTKQTASVLTVEEWTQLKLFAEALSYDKLSKAEVKAALDNKKMVMLATGWPQHTVGIYAHIDDELIKFVHCNRGTGINLISVKGEKNFSGNIILTAPATPERIELLCKVFEGGSAFRNLFFKEAKDFYESFNLFVKAANFELKDFQALKPLKIGNCTVGDIKPLTRTFLSKKAYKEMTNAWRKQKIQELFARLYSSIIKTPQISLIDSMEFQILYNFLLKTEYAFASEKMNKQETLTLIYNLLNKLKNTSGVHPDRKHEIEIALTRFKKDKEVGLKRLSNFVRFTNQQALRAAWNEFSELCHSLATIVPVELDKIYFELLKDENNLPKASLFREALKKMEEQNQKTLKNDAISKSLKTLIEVVSKNLPTGMDLEESCFSFTDDSEMTSLKFKNPG